MLRPTVAGFIFGQAAGGRERSPWSALTRWLACRVIAGGGGFPRCGAAWLCASPPDNTTAQYAHATRILPWPLSVSPNGHRQPPALFTVLRWRTSG